MLNLIHQFINIAYVYIYIYIRAYMYNNTYYYTYVIISNINYQILKIWNMKYVYMCVCVNFDMCMLVNLLTQNSNTYDFNVRDTEDGLHRQVSFLSHRLVGSISCAVPFAPAPPRRWRGNGSPIWGKCRNFMVVWWFMVVNGDLMVI